MLYIARIALLTSLALLCATFMWQFINMQLEQRAIWTWCNENPGFSCDSFPVHMVGGFHFFSFILLALVILSRRYFGLLATLATYLLIHIFGTYERIGTGYFGGDMCPDGHPCFQAIRRASWFDWTATSLLTISIVLTLILASIGNRSKQGSK